jgi:dolichol-phosphate mannosyltransferase
MNTPRLSVLVPVYNESQSLPGLFNALSQALAGQAPYEIILIDDGSHDDSFAVMCRAAAADPAIKVLRFFHNTGQTAALQAGIDYAQGEIIVTIDSDLENDPADIPRLLAKLDEGYDIVSGWRQNRWKKNRFTRRLPSLIANQLISRITGVHLNDYGCTLKAYRSRILKQLRLYGEMHRFIPAYGAWYGARVTEMPVGYAPRKFGRSNYGISRTFRVLLDLLLIRFLRRYLHRPIHFFGGIGALTLALGFIAGGTSVFLKFVHLRDFVETPLPIFSALLIIVGVQFILMGILAEIMMRTYFESQRRSSYTIRDMVNINARSN